MKFTQREQLTTDSQTRLERVCARCKYKTLKYGQCSLKIRQIVFLAMDSWCFKSYLSNEYTGNDQRGETDPCKSRESTL